MSNLSNSMQLILTLVKTHAETLKPLENALAVHGLSFTEWLVMHRLAQASDHTLKRSALASSIGVTASGVTRLLLPMEKTGLVEKVSNARDARVSLVRLSETGAQHYQEATRSLDFSAEKVTNMMNLKQVEQSTGLLSTLYLSAVEASQLS